MPTEVGYEEEDAKIVEVSWRGIGHAMSYTIRSVNNPLDMELYFVPEEGRFVLDYGFKEREDMLRVPYDSYGGTFRDFLYEVLEVELMNKLEACGITTEILYEIPVRHALSILEHHSPGIEEEFKLYLEKIQYGMIRVFLDSVGRRKRIKYVIPTLEELKREKYMERLKDRMIGRYEAMMFWLNKWAVYFPEEASEKMDEIIRMGQAIKSLEINELAKLLSDVAGLITGQMNKAGITFKIDLEKSLASDFKYLFEAKGDKRGTIKNLAHEIAKTYKIIEEATTTKNTNNTKS